MENLAICPHCEREHRVGRGWAFCPMDPKARVQDFHLQLSRSCAGLRSVREREEAFWRLHTGDGSDDLGQISEAARLVLPTVMARLLGARADPNLRALHVLCSAPDPQVHGMDTPLHGVLCRLDYIMETPLHEVLRRLEFDEWHGDNAMSAIAQAVPDCVQLLVRYKADLSLVDAWDRTPVQVVLQHRRAGVNFATGLQREVMKLTEQCVEIMGAEAMASMPSRAAEAATALRHPWCKYCMRSLSSLERRNLRVEACDACYWKGFVVWCAQCEAWRPLVAESAAAAKTCSQCQVLLQRSRHWCQSCGYLHADCACPEEDCDKLAPPAEGVTHLSSGAMQTGGASASSSQQPMPAARPATEPSTELERRRNAAGTRETRKCNNCGTIIVNASGVKPGDYAYCSERCKYPRCNGRAANGKPCAEERTKSKKHNDHRPRYDQEQQWFCTRCRKKQAA